MAGRSPGAGGRPLRWRREMRSAYGRQRLRGTAALQVPSDAAVRWNLVEPMWRFDEKIRTVIPDNLLKICEIGEGMWFVNGASWEHSGCNCRTGGNMVTIRTVGKLKPAGGLTGDARRFRFGDQSPSR